MLQLLLTSSPSLVPILGLLSLFSHHSNLFPAPQHVSPAGNITVVDPADVGIGFDFSLYRASVAVSYRNGTVFDVAHVDGDPDYLKAMRQLSLPESRHPVCVESDLATLKFPVGAHADSDLGLHITTWLSIGRTLPANGSAVRANPWDCQLPRRLAP